MYELESSAYLVQKAQMEIGTVPPLCLVNKH